MKKNYLTLVLIALVIILSCSKSDKVSSNDSGIVGVWNIESVHTIEYNNNIKVDEYTVNMKGTKAEFKSDGRFTVGLNTEDPESGEYRYDASAKTLSLKYDGESSFSTAPIINQTNNKLVFMATVTYNPPLAGVDKEVNTISLSR